MGGISGERKNPRLNGTAYKFGLASLKRTPSHRTLYAMPKNPSHFFLSLEKFTAKVKARFFVR
jgi:hypothetical protein